jgi:hypothetical protein
MAEGDEDEDLLFDEFNGGVLFEGVDSDSETGVLRVLLRVGRVGDTGPSVDESVTESGLGFGVISAGAT